MESFLIKKAQHGKNDDKTDAGGIIIFVLNSFRVPFPYFVIIHKLHLWLLLVNAFSVIIIMNLFAVKITAGKFPL
jgi:hypothetical protein